jgi:glycosyltransferase involved in cell wall biosynthesis
MIFTVFYHSLFDSGAHYSIKRFLELLKDEYYFNMIICRNSSNDVVKDLSTLNIKIIKKSCVRRNVFTEFIIDDEIKNLIKTSDAVWILDDEHITAPKIKRIRDVPVLAYLRNYLIICPINLASYSMKDVCLTKCSFPRIISCKKGIYDHYIKNHYINILSYYVKGRVLVYGKGLLDYVRWLETVDDRLLNSIDLFIAISHAVKEIYTYHIPDLSDKIEVVYNPVLSEDVVRKIKMYRQDSSEDLFITYSSGDLPVKGFMILLKAFREIYRSYKDLKLVLTGEYNNDILKRFCDYENNDICDRIKLLGKIDYQDLLRTYVSSKAVVYPSIWPEPFGRVVAEAQLLGTPVVASDIGGIREIVEDNVTGYLSRPGDPKDLSDKIVLTLERTWNKDLISRKTFEKFNDQVFLRRIKDVIKKVL